MRSSAVKGLTTNVEAHSPGTLSAPEHPNTLDNEEIVCHTLCVDAQAGCLSWLHTRSDHL
jgi:hypothetical protein